MEGHHLIYRVLVSVGAILAVDAITWIFLRKYSRTSNLAGIFRKWHFPISILFGIAFFAYFYFRGLPGLDIKEYQDVYWFTGLFVLIWMPRLFLIIGGIIHLLVSLFNRKDYRFTLPFTLYTIAFVLIVYGILWGKSDFYVREVQIGNEELVAQLPEVSVLQFSDSHIGSFGCTQKARKGFDLIGEQQADLIVFTGDLINVVAEEAYPYREDLKALEAPLGKYAILGNHDIGDYLKGDTIRPPRENRRMLREFFASTGFTLLEDSAVMIKKDGREFVLAGVDNWGLPPFRQEGDLDKALSFFPGAPTLLLSHDPTHWKAEVQDRKEVFLTLSGHTHGMQMGFRFKHWQWSPAMYKYPLWAGLYEDSGQYLYVNVGFGFIGVPLRMGMRPEITLLRIGEPTGE